ncbi:MAG TPA: T9SS C-terminal target domain-containing protein [Flavobacteriales bacterium]|nr:T9SS C-terminal target domain-containing protein [Flavobacteriales bacterium]HMR27660.1 T9SS C-terminal target domain-containing protein [Flavobacteriales bacterium]
MNSTDRMTPTRILALASLFLFGTLATTARESQDRGPQQGRSNGQAVQAKAAGCSPSTARDELDLNNVRALIETGGNMWQRRDGAGGPAYEVPKTEDRSGPDALFAGSLWLGGVSPDNQLKLAAVRFRQVGNDYWPGPLTNTGDASITADVCVQFDKTWKTLRQDAELHRAYHRCRLDPACDENVEFPNYVMPTIYEEWPAHGNIDLNQDYNLAPYADEDGSDDYNPEEGDYPGYDLDGEIDCTSRKREDAIPLFGDQNIWWVFNDKGNAHTESGGLPIGMEIRAQAFAFATNDAVNNMTFYNYVLINQGTQTLLNTYMGQWADVDLGCADDDYVGCDVQRGLGYAYNGDNNDENCNGNPGYGVQPPAMGIDFFEGPFQDYDDLDNPGPATNAEIYNCQNARDSLGIPYKGIGIGYGDGVVDNERYGMRAYLYHNNNSTVTGDPQIAINYYNYLRAIWRDNSPNLYGGTGHQADAEADPNTPARYMFPGDSDPTGWGTDCVPQAPWTEETSGNQPFDRRFIQSAGPFTLEPGAYNNVTVGVVWARATGGGPFESVQEVRRADDKAQALFDNCFRILNGPDAPELGIVELDRQLILTIENLELGNNFNETYTELDPTIPEDALDREYHFQGYQVYQLRDADVSVADLGDVNLARLVFQCDVKDGVRNIINYIEDPAIALPVPTLMVTGSDDGISHSFSVTEDKFAQGDPRLINFKTYYFMAIAYGYNNYQDFNPDPQLLTGQALPYLAGRKSATGAIKAFSGIPHKNTPENGGTVLNAEYGDQFTLTRLEGVGNNDQPVMLNNSTIDLIMNGQPWRQDQLTYVQDMGPVNIKVIDPLAVKPGNFELWFTDSITDGDLDDAGWMLVYVDGQDTILSDRTIEARNEQLIPEYGLSVTIQQGFFSGQQVNFTDFLEAEITYADPSIPWLSGIPDGEGEDALNWIRAGLAEGDEVLYPDRVSKGDIDEQYESVLVQEFDGFSGGTWAPFALVGDTAFQPGGPNVAASLSFAQIRQLGNTLVVLTADRNKWTRCGVIEMEDNPGLAVGNVQKHSLRASPSVDKFGRRSGTPGCNEDEATLFGAQPNGMGWFPGYAIDLLSGERLNMAFGEASFWGGAGGRDMIWNPSDTLVTPLGSPVFGGQHWIFVFRNGQREEANPSFMPQYDQGQFIYDKLTSGTVADRNRVYRACSWVGSALRNHGFEFRSMNDGLIPTETRIRLNVVKPYETYREPFAGYTPTIAPQLNDGLPLYRFNTGERAPVVQDAEAAQTACDMIDVVPNPYYGFSSYETSRLDNRVKFINLPQRCDISIYNVSGTLVRRYKKDNALTFLDWDLRNQINVPVASGVYICHFEVPGVCERVVKWFGVMRPTDLQNF